MESSQNTTNTIVTAETASPHLNHSTDDCTPSNSLIKLNNQNVTQSSENINISLDQYLAAPLSEVAHHIPHFYRLSHSMIVKHTESVATVLHKLRSRTAVVAKYIKRWDLSCRTPTSNFPQGSKVYIKKRMCYKLFVQYSFFDIRDLSYYVMRLYQENPCRSVDDILDLVRKEKVGKIANISGRVPFKPKQMSDSVGSIVAAFGPCCRVPIFSKNQLVRVMAPSDLLTLLLTEGVIQQIEKKQHPILLFLYYVRAQNVDIRSVAKTDFMTLMESDSLLKAISMMERHGYSAIPIVSEENFNHVVDVITVKDIKYLLTAQTLFGGSDVLNSPALSYIRVLRKPTDQSKAEWAFLPDKASLDEIFGVFMKTQAHRLVLRNDAGNMTGLLTLTDMMKKLAEALATKEVVPVTTASSKTKLKEIY